jgi:hypothetical protein
VQPGGADGLQYWWNRDKDRCLEVHVQRGRVARAEVREEKQCRDAGKHAQVRATRATQRGFSDMIGMRASNLDAEMQARGFRNTGGYKRDGASYTTWWNGTARECVSIATRDGQVSTVESTGEGNCR